MKKIMAMVLSVVMLLTMAVAMPVMADDEVNLIVNGSFEEVDQDGALVGWTQVNPANPMIRYENGTTAINGKPVSNATNGTYFIFNNTIVAGGAGVKQTVNLASDAAWVTNQAKYNFNLYFDYYWAYGTPWVDVKVTAYDAEGFTYSKTFVGDNGGWELPAGNWTMSTASVDVSSVIDMSPAPIVKLDIEILTQNKHEGSDYASSSWDNVKLVPVYDADKTVAPMNLIRNGSFEMGEGSSITGWTQGNENNLFARTTTKVVDGQYSVANTYDAATGAGSIKQTINLASDAAWVTNQGKYDFNLAFSHHFAYSDASFTVNVTVYDANGVYATKNYVGFANANGSDHPNQAKQDAADFVPGGFWGVFENTINIAPLMNELTGAATKIDVEFIKTAVAGDWVTAYIDNVKLIPAYNENKVVEKDNNLLVNGGFELYKDGQDANAIYGWTQEGYTGTNLYFSQGLHEWWTKSNTAYYQVDTSSTSSVGVISQTVSFDESSPIYYDYPAYDFNLSMDVYLPTSYYKGRTELEVTGADGTVATATINYDFASSATWNMNSFTYGIKSLVGDTIGDQPIKSIKVKLIGTGGVQMIAYDNVKLVPVYDESKKPVNLITNGHFGLTGETETDIPGWTQEGSGTNSDVKYFKQGKDLYTSREGSVFATLNNNAAIFTAGSTESWIKAVLTQTVTMDADADWYKNPGAYDYKLSMDVYKYSSGFKGAADVIVTGADGTQATANLALTGANWETASLEYDIKELVNDTIGDQAIASIKVVLTGGVGGASGCITFDNVKLVPVKTADVAIVDGNGAEVNEIATAEDATFVANATYTGSDAGAYAYIAVYAVNNGVYRLVAANGAPFAEGVAAPKVEGVNTVAGTTVVKAFIWDSQGISVIGKLVD